MEYPATTGRMRLNGPIAAYSRVSTDEQRERATIETQHAKIAEYCTEHGITLSHSYSDNGWSGRRFHLNQRPGGQQLLSDTQSHHLETLIVYRADRLGRGRKLLSAIDQLESSGIRTIVSVTEQTFDLRSPTDVFLLTMLSGVSGYEAESTLQRSSDATQRLAREGQWLGGIVPYGYRVVGVKRTARLVPSEEPIPGRSDGLSEAGVVQLIFRLVVTYEWTAQRIADHLNALGVPPAYVRDERLTIQHELKGKRTVRVQGIWRAGRITNMLHNTTYYGIHSYGKRSTTEGTAVIERPAPPLVDKPTWDRAQEVLKRHQIMSVRNAKHTYLLRGLIRCGCCGLSYNGLVMNNRRLSPQQMTRVRAGNATYDRRPTTYYRCNGASQFRGIYGKKGQRCPSKSINGERLEAAIWRDIEYYLRHPDEVIEEIMGQLDERKSDPVRDEVADLQLAIARKAEERQSVLTLYRRGRIDEPTLDRQLETIQQEEADLQDTLKERQTFLATLLHAEETLQTATDLLKSLGAWLDEQPDAITPQQKRHLIETLVDRIIVKTISPEDPVPEPQIWANPLYRDWRKRQKTVAHVVYRFTPPPNNSPATGRGEIAVAVTHTGMDSWR